MDQLEFMLDAIRKIYANDRFYSYDSMWKTSAVVEEMMRSIGMTGVKTYAFPSDGVVDYAGWQMPLGWNPKKGGLNLILPDGKEEKICSYADVPCSLMLYSRSGEATAEMALPDEPDLRGKIVLVSDHGLSMKETLDLTARGAAGVLCSFLRNPYENQPGLEYLADVCQWCNYSMPFWPVENHPWGFSLTPNQGRKLLALKEKNGKVILHATVEAEMKPGSIPLVSALLPGETDEEIAIAGHLFEEGANDNASGVAAALAIVRELAGKKRKRGIRLLFTHECKSMQAYVNALQSYPHYVAGLIMDMIGVSTDNVARIADGAPSCASYATPLIRHCLIKHGFEIKISGITGNDLSIAEPTFGAATTGIDILADANYHHSSDTPDRIDAKCLQRSYEAALDYVSLLVNAGAKEALEIAALTAAYDREFSFVKSTPEMARRIACERIDTVLKLVPEAEKAAVGKAVDALKPAPAVPEKMRECAALRAMIPLKKFRGFFSFERFWLRDAEHPRLASLFTGWAAASWVDHALVWADGSRNAEEIWNLLLQSGYQVEPELFAELLNFLSEKQYIALRCEK